MRLRQVFAGIGIVAMATSGLVAFGPTTGAGANPTPGIPPDFVLEPDGPIVSRTVKSTLIGAQRSEGPESCRTSPVFSNVCDVFRLKLNLSKAPGAQNFVVIFLDFPFTRAPEIQLPLVACTACGNTNPELDLVVYRTPFVALPPAVVGGQDFTIPERVAFIANQTEYDIVVKNDVGVSDNYTLRMFMTDEIFDSQFELLDEVQKRIEETPTPTPPPADDTPFVTPPAEPISSGDSNALAPLPVIDRPTLDSRINGIGLGTRGNFDFGAPPQGPRTQAIVNLKEPSGVSLLFGLVLVPLAAAVGGALWLRRRRQALI